MSEFSMNKYYVWVKKVPLGKIKFIVRAYTEAEAKKKALKMAKYAYNYDFLSDPRTMECALVEIGVDKDYTTVRWSVQ